MRCKEEYETLSQLKNFLLLNQMLIKLLLLTTKQFLCML